jgi:hypothetical protein
MAKGQKTGGRTAGTPNKVNSTLLELVEAEAGGPLPVLLARAGRKAEEQGDLQLAVAAWAKAATFVYPRLQAVEANAKGPVFIPPLFVVDGKASLPPDWPGPIVTISREVIRSREDLT